MLYTKLDEMISKGWHLHAVNVPEHSLYVFLLHSEHHPSETTYVEDEFITMLHDDPSEKRMRVLDRWLENHPLCPFIVNCSSLNNGLKLLEELLQNADRTKRLSNDIKEWKKFLDKFYYSHN